MKYTINLFLLLSVLAGCSFKKDTPPQVVEVTPAPTKEKLTNDLFEAVLKEDYASVESLVKAGVSLEEYDQQGHTVLMRAVQIRNPILVNILISGKAKIYAPLKSDPKITAFDKINSTDLEIKNLFSAESLRLASTVKDSIDKQKFSEALSFTKDNFLPLSLTIADKLSLADYVIFSTNSDDSNAISFIKYLFDGRAHDYANISQYFPILVEKSSTVKSMQLFEYLADKFASTGHLSAVLISNSDANDGNWLQTKLSILSKRNIGVDYTYLEKIVRTGLENLTKTTFDKNVFLGIFDKFLSFNYTPHEKNSSTDKILTFLLNESQVNESLLLVCQDTIETWSTHKITPSGFSVDVYISRLFAALQGGKFNHDLINTSMSKLLSFTTNRDNIESLKFALSDKFTNEQKSYLLGLILSYNNTLPKGTIALVATPQTSHILTQLLSSGAIFVPSENADAIVAAVGSSSSGDTAKTLILALKEAKIPFNNNFGASALLDSFKKLWNNDQTYSIVIDFLISISDSPLNSLQQSEIIELLNTHIDYLIKKNSGWSQLSQMLQKMNPVTSSAVFSKENYLIGKKKYALRSSLTWNFILLMFEETKKTPNDLESMFTILGQMFQKFPTETTSMVIVENNMSFNPSIYLTQQIFPLSFLFWAGKEAIEPMITRDPTKIYTYPRFNPTIAFNVLIESNIYEYYSANKDFWARIVSILPDTQLIFNGTKDKSYSDFLEVLVSTDALEAFPKLSSKIDTSNIQLSEDYLQCNISTQELADKAELYSTTVKDWSTVGTLASLTPLQVKSCGGVPLSTTERMYAADFIRNNFDDNTTGFSSLGTKPGVVQACDPSKDFSSGTPPKTFEVYNYSETGTLLLPETSSDSDLSDLLLHLNNKCVFYPYNSDAHNAAKKIFINNWMKCAQNSKDDKLVLEFQTLESKFKFSEVSINVNLCGW